MAVDPESWITLEEMRLRVETGDSDDTFRRSMQSAAEMIANFVSRHHDPRSCTS